MNPPSGEWPIDDEHHALITAVARAVRRQIPTVDTVDLIQDLCLWWHGKATWIAKQLEQDEEKGVYTVTRALTNQARGICWQAKIDASGCERSDLYFYSTGTLREILPDVFERSSWLDQTGPAEAGSRRRSKPASEGSERLASLVDVAAAVARLRKADRELLLLAYGLGLSDEEIAGRVGVVANTVKQRVHRAMGRLQRELGGSRPDWPHHGRRAMSNAAASALTRRDWEDD